MSRRTDETSAAPWPDAENAWEPKTPQDQSFWTSMIAADKRLAELRRVIDQVAAEAISDETCVPASQSVDPHADAERRATEDS